MLADEEVRVMYIPEYIYNALLSKGFDLTKLEYLVTNTKDIEEVKNELSKYISKLDIDTFLSAAILSNVLGTKLPDFQENESEGMNEKYMEPFRELISIYTNNKVDIPSIILSKTDTDVELPWRLQAMQDRIVLVILQDGFFNFITYNIKEFKIYFLEILTNFMAKMYGIEGTNISLSTNTLINYYFNLV